LNFINENSLQNEEGMSRLLKLLDGVSEWSQLHSRLSSLSKPTKTGKRDGGQGKHFEREFCKAYFKIVPQAVKEFSEVWLGDEVPANVKKKLGIGSDHGIDLVLKKKSGKLVAVQCKFEGKPENRISWSKHKIANLFADGDKADGLIIFTSAGGVDKHTLSKRKGELQIICYADLDALDPLVFENMRSYLSGKEIKYEPINRRPYQEDAVSVAKEHFRKYDRGQLILPCGAGKTIVSLWIKEELNSKKTLVLCPTLAILRQTRIEWLAAQQCFVPYMCVCSEKDVDGTDGIRISIAEIGGQVSTDPVQISSFLKTYDSEIIVFSTYKSSPRIAEAIRMTPAYELNFANPRPVSTGFAGNVGQYLDQIFLVG
jgi:predicted helicase